jgi:ribosome-associated translation inhibitor RaiA
MRRADSNERLHIEIDNRHCHLSQDDLAKMQDNLESLTRMVEHFPRPELRVNLQHTPRNDEYLAKTTLILPGETLVASEHGPTAHAAYEECVRVLMDQLKEYKDRLGQMSDRQKMVEGTHNQLEPTIDPDQGALDAAVAAGDYAAFRSALQGYEEPLRDRVGRWLERYAQTDGQVGRPFTIADVVEEVFLAAFEDHEHRGRQVRFGDWLDGLIDPAIKELTRHPDEELENVRMVRSMQGVPATREES